MRRRRKDAVEEIGAASVAMEIEPPVVEADILAILAGSEAMMNYLDVVRENFDVGLNNARNSPVT
jgi:hypothetical protein